MFTAFPDIPWLSSVQSRIRRIGASRSGSARYFPDSALELELEQLPYCLEGLRRSLLDLEALAKQLAEQNSNIGVDAVVLVDAAQADSLRRRVDAFFDIGRRGQNSIMPYIARTLGFSLPQSIARITESPHKYPKIPNAILDMIQQYWMDGGSALKGYRDLSQHYAIVSSEVRVRRLSSGPFGVFVALPNDPLARSAKNLVYAPPHINAIQFCRAQYFAFYSFAYELTYALLVQLGFDQNAEIVTVFRAPRIFSAEGYADLSVAPIEETISHLRPQLKTHCLKVYGEIRDITTIPNP